MTIYNIGKYIPGIRRLVHLAAAVALFATQLSPVVAAQSVAPGNRESIASEKEESVASDISGKADKALQGSHPRCETPLIGVAGNSLRGLECPEGGNELPSLSLTLAECREMAMRNNAALNNAELDIRAAWLRKQEALSEYFPRVSATAFGYWAMNPLLEIGVTDILGNNDFAWNIQNELESFGSLYGINTKYTAFKRGYSASVMAIQPLYAGGRIVTGNRLAALGIEAAQLQKGIRHRETLETVDSLWWQVVSLSDKLETLDYLGGTLDTLYSSLSAAIGSGLAAETDILQLKLKRTELKAARRKVTSGIRLSKMNLFNAIGQPYTIYSSNSTPERPFVDSLTLDTVSELPAAPDAYWRDEDEIVASMQETRLLDLQVKAKRLEQRLAIGEALPQVAVGASTGYSNLYKKGRYNAIAFASVQIPLSDWGKTARRAQRIGTEIEKAENDRDYLDSQLHLLVGKLWLDLTSAYDSWQLAEESHANSRRLYEVSLSNFSAGLIPLQDLLQAETACRTAASARVDALISYRNAIVAYTSRGE